MTNEQVTLLKDALVLIIFLLPVLTLFWKVARYSTKIEELLNHKSEEINALKDRIRDIEAKNIDGYNKIQVEVSNLKETTKVADKTNIKQDGVLEEHGSRITKLEDKTEGMSETLTQIREENSKQTAMLELLVDKNK